MAILFALLTERRKKIMEVSRATPTNHCSMFHERSNFAFALSVSLTRYQPKRISFKQLQSSCVAVGMFCVVFSTVFCWHFFIQYFLRANILAGIVYNNQFTIDILEYKTQITTCFLEIFLESHASFGIFSLSHLSYLTVHTVSTIVYT